MVVQIIDSKPKAINDVEYLANLIEKFTDSFILKKNLFHSLISEDSVTGKNEFKVMSIISENPDCSVGYIAEQIKLDISTVTHILNQMFDKGFIYRQRNQKDRRNVMIRLSEKGIDSFQKNKLISNKMNQSMLNIFNHDEINKFSNLLEKFFSNNSIVI